MPNEWTCPNCGEPQCAPDSPTGASLSCRACGAPIPLDAPVRTVSDPSPPPAPARAGAPAFVGQLPAPAEWRVGDVILDLYEVLAFLGEGGMGRVWKVHHRGWNMDLAVKTPRPDFFRTDEQKRAFLQEAENWVNLGLHPHVVSCYYARPIGGVPRVFEEFVEGGTLSHWIGSRRLYEGGGARALGRVLDIAVQTAWGLAHAHERGLVHQDVKPHNVMMTPDGTAKVTDFGLARVQGVVQPTTPLGGAPPADGRDSVTWAGMTPAYCSPEQAARRRVSRATDAWSWAVLVLEMFKGGVTWLAGQAARAALDEYVQNPPEEPFLPRIPPQVIDVLRACLEHDPGTRQSDLSEAADALRRAYRKSVGSGYPRQEPQTGEMLADDLNNRAVSLLDLGTNPRAEWLLEDALEAGPGHLFATFNRNLLLWRSARMTDDAVLRPLRDAMEADPTDRDAPLLLAWAHVERGDEEGALAALRELRNRRGSSSGSGQSDLMAAIATGCRLERTFEGHSNYISSVACAPDGTFAVTASYDKTLQVWDLTVGRPGEMLEGNSCRVTSVALIPAQQLVACGGADGGVRVWDLERKTCTLELKGHTDTVTGIAASPEGRRVASSSADGTARLWSLVDGSCLQVLSGHTKSVSSIVISGDGAFAVTGSYDRTLGMWDLASGRCRRRIEGHAGMVAAVAISPDGMMTASCGMDRVVRLWSTISGRPIRTLDGHTDCSRALVFLPDGQHLLSAGEDRVLRLWDVTSGRCLCSMEGHRQGVNGLALAQEGRMAVSCSSDRTVRVWRLSSACHPAPFMLVPPRSSEQALRTREDLRRGLESCRTFLETGNLRAAVSELNRVRALPGCARKKEVLEVWSEASRRTGRGALRGAWLERVLDGHTGAIRYLAISPDGTTAVSAGGDMTARVWDLRTGHCIHVLHEYGEEFAALACSFGGETIVTAHGGSRLYVWPLKGDQPRLKLDGHSAQITSIAITPDGRLATSIARDSSLRVWDVSSGKQLRSIPIPARIKKGIAMTPDGLVAVTASTDGTVGVWDLSSGECVVELPGHQGQVLAVGVTSDTRLCLSCGQDMDVRVWDLRSGECLRRLQGHREYVGAVAWALMGRIAASAGVDETVRIWDVDKGECARVLQAHQGAINAVALSPDGETLLSAGEDKALRVWRLDWDLEVREPSGWDDGIRPYIESFLSARTGQSGEDLLDRTPPPACDQDALQTLRGRLEREGWGWIAEKGLQEGLDRAVSEWQPLRARIRKGSDGTSPSAGLPAIAAVPRYDLRVDIDILGKLESLGEPSRPTIPGFELAGAPQTLWTLEEVYQAKDSRGESVSIHVTRSGLVLSDPAQRAIEEAIRVRPLLRHENIRKVRDWGFAQGRFFVALESLEGRTLEDLLKEGAKLPLAVARRIGLGALRGLAILHGLGMRHGDIQPWRIHVIDVGGQWIPKLTCLYLNPSLLGPQGREDEPILTRSQVLFSPREVVRGKEVSTPASDVWSVAATLYRTVTGEFPRDAERYKDPMVAALRGRIVPILDRDPSLPKPFAEVMDRALADRIEDRYPTAVEFLAALETAFASFPGDEKSEGR